MCKPAGVDQRNIKSRDSWSRSSIAPGCNNLIIVVLWMSCVFSIKYAFISSAFHQCVSSARFICVFDQWVSSVCFISVCHLTSTQSVVLNLDGLCKPTSTWRRGATKHIVLYRHDRLGQNKLLFFQAKASTRQCRRPLTHRDRAGWMHFLQVITNWAIVPGPRLLKLNCKSQI